MFSILIPTYNYNAFPLVKILEGQALKLGIIFEIICIDDGSFSELNKENQLINSLVNSKFIESKNNVGSKGNRQNLAEKAQYEWLLFIDADSEPKSSSYLNNYINATKRHYDAIFGGFSYDYKLDNNSKSLRYSFGKQREEKSALIRNKNPYKVIISANFLIKRNLFLTINKGETINIYGLDYLFSANLKEHKVNILHIENEVYHLGLDTNDKFLEKTHKAVEALFYINESKKIKIHSISLLRTYKILKMFGLNHLFSWLFFTFKFKLKTNITGRKPNLFLFDMYRLGYLCTLVNPT